MLVTGVRGKAGRMTFGINSANKKVRNNKSPFKGKDTVFFLTRDLPADAPADSKENKGEVNRGNRKKRVALNNKLFFVLYNLFIFSEPYVLWERIFPAAPCLPHVCGCCVCALCPVRAATIPTFSMCAGEEWRSVGAQKENTEGGQSDQEWGLCPTGTGVGADLT